jgi:biopolymer transport protein ExbD
MSIDPANVGGMKCEMNVTPLIDILLVLLIVFMVIVPAIPKGETALAPRGSNDARDQAVVLDVLRGSGGDTNFRINKQVVSRQDLPARLAGIYAKRAQRVLFVKGDDRLQFTQIAEVIDLSHAAGVDHVGLLTPKTAAGL